jgi:hypothetical protein
MRFVMTRGHPHHIETTGQRCILSPARQKHQRAVYKFPALACSNLFSCMTMQAFASIFDFDKYQCVCIQHYQVDLAKATAEIAFYKFKSSGLKKCQRPIFK